MARRPRIDVIVQTSLTLVDSDAAPTQVLTLLAKAYEAKGVDPVLAAEYADDQLSVALIRLQERADELQSEGRSSTWIFNPSDPTYIQGSCYVMEKLDEPETIAAKKRLHHLWKSADVISGLNPLDFERLCTLVLIEIGVSDVFLTARRADQGIDFFGRLSVRSKLAELSGYPPLLDKLTMWVIGQAKQFETSQVATFDLRELVGSIELARAKAYGLEGDRYPMLDMKVADPVIALFFTSGQVSREARILARSSGVLMIDGEAMAHLLAHANVGFHEDGTFDEKLFAAAVKEVVVQQTSSSAG